MVRERSVYPEGRILSRAADRYEPHARGGKPSVYQETIKTKGHGFHHWAICSKSFDQDVAAYEAADYPVAFSDISPRGVRIVYVDTSRDLPGMLEIIETTDALEAIYQSYFDASQNWDGKDPVRRWSLKSGS